MDQLSWFLLSPGSNPQIHQQGLKELDEFFDAGIAPAYDVQPYATACEKLQNDSSQQLDTTTSANNKNTLYDVCFNAKDSNQQGDPNAEPPESLYPAEGQPPSPVNDLTFQAGDHSPSRTSPHKDNSIDHTEIEKGRTYHSRQTIEINVHPQKLSSQSTSIYDHEHLFEPFQVDSQARSRNHPQTPPPAGSTIDNPLAVLSEEMPSPPPPTMQDPPSPSPHTPKLPSSKGRQSLLKEMRKEETSSPILSGIFDAIGPLPFPEMTASQQRRVRNRSSSPLKRLLPKVNDEHASSEMTDNSPTSKQLDLPLSRRKSRKRQIIEPGNPMPTNASIDNKEDTTKLTSSEVISNRRHSRTSPPNKPPGKRKQSSPIPEPGAQSPQQSSQPQRKRKQTTTTADHVRKPRGSGAHQIGIREKESLGETGEKGKVSSSPRKTRRQKELEVEAAPNAVLAVKRRHHRG